MATNDHPFCVSPGWRALREAADASVLAAGVVGEGPVVVLFDTRPPGRVAPPDGATVLEAALRSCMDHRGTVLGLGDDLVGMVLPVGGPAILQGLVERVGHVPGAPAFAWGASQFPADGAGADDLLSVAVGRLGDLRVAGQRPGGDVGGPRRHRRTAGAIAAAAALLGGVLLPVTLTSGPNLFTASPPHRGLAAADGTAHGRSSAGGPPTSAPASIPPQAAPGTTTPPSTAPPAPVPVLAPPSAPEPGGGIETDGTSGPAEVTAPPEPAPSPTPTTPPTTAPPSPTTTQPDGGGGSGCLLLCDR